MNQLDGSEHRRHDPALRATWAQIEAEISQPLCPKRLKGVVHRLALPGCWWQLVQEGPLRGAILDYALFADRHGGPTLVEQYRAQAPIHGAEDGEASRLRNKLIAAAGRSAYGVFRVVEVTPGVGATLEDALTHDRQVLPDPGLGERLAPGEQIGLRLLPVDGVALATATPLPILFWAGARAEPAGSDADRAKLQAAVIGAYAEHVTGLTSPVTACRW